MLQNNLNTMLIHNAAAANPMLNPNKRRLMIRLISAMLTYAAECDILNQPAALQSLESKQYAFYLEPTDDMAELQRLIDLLEIRKQLNDALIALHTSLTEKRQLALAELQTTAQKNPFIAALQPQITAAIHTTYSPHTVAQFMSIQNTHPPAPILLQDIHPAFHETIRKEHAGMVRARARHDQSLAAKHAAGICHHIVYGQQFYIPAERKKIPWIKHHNQHIVAFAQSTQYRIWTNRFATQLAIAAIFQIIFQDRSAQRYGGDDPYCV